MRTYNCSVCHYAELYSTHKRTCFLFETFPNGDRGKLEGDYFKVPRFTRDHKVDSDTSGRVADELRFLDADGFLQVLWDLSEALPHYSAFQILQSYFREVCPTAFADEVMASLISAQTSVSEYKIDISNESLRFEILGFNMSLRDTLEAFDIITSARNAYERYDMERIQRENNKAAG